MTTPNSQHPLPGDDDPAVQAYRLRCVESDVKTVIKKLEGIELKIAVQPTPCPSPGLCTQLKTRVDELDRKHSEETGAKRALIFISSAVSAVLTFLGYEFFQNLHLGR